MSIIVVNATALENSGGLIVLKQFIKAIPEDKSVYILFVSDKVELQCKQSNVRLVLVKGVKPICKRFFWDAFGIARWLKKHAIKPDLSISLQNTNFRTGYKIPNYIYFHQSIPFAPQKWSPFIKEQRSLWFYKNIYPWFVALFINNRTSAFVQLEYIKDGFSKFFRFPRNRIHVIAPNVDFLSKGSSEELRLETQTINLFYPATLFFYKNHTLLVDALKRVNSADFTLYLTCGKSASYDITNESFVKCIGLLSREEIWEMYRKADALVFPSYIETFGLPLIEAASVGLPILCADLPYAREVLSAYEGVTFVDHTNPEAWAEKIGGLIKGKKYKPYLPSKTDSWNKLFEIINHNLYV